MKLVWIVLLLLGFVAPVGAQETAAYVSRLTAQAGPTSVLLTWKDAEGWTGAKYEVWRSSKEIVKDSLAQAKLLATVNSGVEAFEDITVTEPSFYLVLLKDPSGNRRSYFVPYRNKTAEAVKPDSSATKATAKIKVGNVSYANPQVLIPFSAYPADRKLAVYRRSGTITSLADLKDATLLGNTTGAQAPYRDTPPPGLEFWYAVVDAQAFADGKSDVFQTENTTDRPVGFPLVALPATVTNAALDANLRPGLDLSTRALPLPLLQVDSDPGSGSPLIRSAYQPIAALPLPAEAAVALRTWSRASKPGLVTLPEPVVLPEERSATQTGAGQYLVQIQNAYLQPRDWKGAVTALDSVVKLSLDSRTEARARFYRGEALAYLKRYREAFLEFVSARNAYPEANAFIEALFTLLPEETD